MREKFQLFQIAKMPSTKYPEGNDWISHVLKWFFFHTFDDTAFFFAHKKKGLKEAENVNFFKLLKMALTKSPEANDWFLHLLKCFFSNTFDNKALYCTKKKKGF